MRARSVLIVGTLALASLGFFLGASTGRSQPLPCAHLIQILPGLCSHGDDPRGAQASSVAPTGQIVCDGDGVSGRRVQVLVGRASDVPDHLNDATPVQWAQGIDGIYDTSAQQTGGHRHVRFVTNRDCTLHVDTVTLPTSADDDFGATITALQNLGYNRADRKYILFMDASVYCGIGTVIGDDTPKWNSNDQQAGYSRVDRVCWNAPTAAHELTHNLGGVQLSAPHSDGTWHCTQSPEVMCYGGTQTYDCPPDNLRFLDCGHDDYFTTGSDPYLDTHWNVATSQFLIGAPDPGPSPTPSPTRNCIKLVVKLCR